MWWPENQKPEGDQASVRLPDQRAPLQYFSRTRFASKKSGLSASSADPKCVEEQS